MSTPGFMMPFGKHKGTPITDVPSGYVEWLAAPERIGMWHAPTRAAIEAEAARRAALKPTPPPEAPRIVVTIDAEALIAAGVEALNNRLPGAEAAIAMVAAELRSCLVAF